LDLGLQASLQLLSVFVAFPCIVVRVQRGVDRSGGHHRVGIGLVGAEEGFSQSGLACLLGIILSISRAVWVCSGYLGRILPSHPIGRGTFP